METKTAFWIIEKDYALSYLLSAIYQTPHLKNKLVLKGGTALKKAYFKDYRFSEDLDFSVLHKSIDAEIQEQLGTAISIMKQTLQERGPFDIRSEPLTLREPHPGKQIAYTVWVQFPYHREPLCRLKVEITMDEPVLLAAESKTIIHEYDEVIEANIKVYQLAEIVVEKYRALLQSLARVKKKGWGASRVCRDYYDLWWILKSSHLSSFDIPALLDEKSAIRNVKLYTIDMFFDEALHNVAENEWKKLLIPFIPEPVTLETVFSELQSITQALWRSYNGT